MQQKETTKTVVRTVYSLDPVLMASLVDARLRTRCCNLESLRAVPREAGGEAHSMASAMCTSRTSQVLAWCTVPSTRYPRSQDGHLTKRDEDQGHRRHSTRAVCLTRQSSLEG